MVLQRNRTIVRFAFAWTICTVACSSGRGSDKLVRIHLPRTVQARTELVKLGDIAQVTGGNPVRRRQIAQLDIAERPRTDDTEKLSLQQIALRVQLSGIPLSEFSVTGAQRVHVSWGSKALDDSAVLESLRPKLADRLNVDANDLQIRLTRPLPASANSNEWGDAVLEPFLPTTVRLGPLTMRLGVYREGKLLQTLNVSVDVRLFRRIFVTDRRIAAGQQITENDVHLERRPLAQRALSDSAENVIGQTLRRTLQANEIVLQSALAAKRQTKSEVVIRARDLVALTARKGGSVAREGGAGTQLLRSLSA